MDRKDSGGGGARQGSKSGLSITRLTLDVKSTWLPILVLAAVVLLTMVAVSVYTDGESISIKYVVENDQKPREDMVQERALLGKNVSAKTVVQLGSTFFSLVVLIACISFDFGSTLELWLLAAPWCAWMMFSSFTLSGGLDVIETISVVASCISITMILLTYSHYIRCRRTAVLIVLMVCLASIIFFPHSGANAFNMGPKSMITHVTTFCATYVIIGYFDALMGERNFSPYAGNQAVRVLRLGWVLFVENRLLFFLVPQILITILHLNFIIATQTFTNSPDSVVVMDMEPQKAFLDDMGSCSVVTLHSSSSSSIL